MKRLSSLAAIVYEGQEITYATLRELTLQTAMALRSLNVGPGDRVAILLHDSPEFIAAFISICSSGAIAVPLNMGIRPEEQRTILNDCGAKVAIAEADLCSTLLTDADEKLQSVKTVLIVSRSALEEDLVRQVPAPGSINRGSSQPRAVRIRLLSELLKPSESPSQPVFPPPDTGKPAIILYTSGSTGEPKGAIHRQADIFYTNQAYCREVLQLTSGDRLFSSSRLPFAYGLGNSLSFPLLNGGTTILCRERPTAEVIGRLFVQARPTIFFSVPVVYSLLLHHHKNIGALNCSSLRLCVSAGEALPAHLGEEWEQTFGVQILDGIGSTEMMHMFISNRPGDLRYGSSGKVLKGYSARLLDEHGNPTPAGAEGNLWIKGESAAVGYWGRAETTARTFVGGWVRTGDLYRIDTDGFWFHMGRSDDCFKSSGQWVSPVEVEGVLLNHPDVLRAAVVEDFDADGLPCACAFIVPGDVKSDCTRTEAELHELTRSTLPRFKRPRRYVFVAELPYTATGKIKRFSLREQLRQQSKREHRSTTS